MEAWLNKENFLQEGYKEFKAPAKINLFLKVIGKRGDGFHKLQSVFQLIDLYDYISTSWHTLLKQRLLGGMGIVFDLFLLEMLRGIILFLRRSL